MDRGPGKWLSSPVIRVAVCETRKGIQDRIKVMQHDDLIVSFLIGLICHSSLIVFDF